MGNSTRNNSGNNNGNDAGNNPPVEEPKAFTKEYRVTGVLGTYETATEAVDAWIEATGAERLPLPMLRKMLETSMPMTNTKSGETETVWRMLGSQQIGDVEESIMEAGNVELYIPRKQAAEANA